MYKTLILLILLGLPHNKTFAGNLSGLSATEKTKADKQKITVVTEVLPPFQIQMAGGEIGGYSTQIVRALFELTSDEYEIKILPWARAYALALKEKNVLIYSLSYSNERAKLFHWIGTLEKEKGYLWGLKRKFNQPFSQLDQAKAYWISTTQNSNPHAFLQKNGFDKLNIVTRPEQNVVMLFRDRIQVTIGTELPFRYMVKKLGFNYSQARKLYQVDGISADLKLAFGHKSDKALVEKYQQAFKQLQSSGRYDEIRRSWGLSSSTEANNISANKIKSSPGKR